MFSQESLRLSRNICEQLADTEADVADTSCAKAEAFVQLHAGTIVCDAAELKKTLSAKGGRYGGRGLCVMAFPSGGMGEEVWVPRALYM